MLCLPQPVHKAYSCATAALEGAELLRGLFAGADLPSQEETFPFGGGAFPSQEETGLFAGGGFGLLALGLLGVGRSAAGAGDRCS